MKKEEKRAAKLRLARETMVQLDDRLLQSVAGGCNPWTGPTCCPENKTDHCDV